tara:strand:- start:212 stop:649 length:438 start_codon:yes stop_codon:yes gene_type:complete
MGVPNTTTFELQDVVDEVNPTTDDLVDCFADANASYFDSTYEGSKNQLLNFRNYGSGNALTQFSGSSGQNDFKFLCSQTTGTSYWHNGGVGSPNIGDIVYTNAAGTTAFNCCTYMLTGEAFGLWLEFDGTGNQGEVTDKGLCSPP